MLLLSPDAIFTHFHTNPWIMPFEKTRAPRSRDPCSQCDWNDERARHTRQMGGPFAHTVLDPPPPVEYRGA